MQKKIIKTREEFEDWLKKKKETSAVVLKTDLIGSPKEFPCMIVWTTVGLNDSKSSQITYYGFIYIQDTIWEE